MKNRNQLLVSSLLVVVSSVAFAKDRTIQDVRYANPSFLVENSKILNETQEYSRDLLEKIQTEIGNCGLTLSSISCLDTGFNKGSRMVIENPNDNNSFLSLSLISTLDQNQTIALVFEINKDDSLPMAKSLKIYSVKKDADLDKTIYSLLSGKLDTLIDVELPASVTEFARKNIQEAVNFKQVYHAALTLSADANNQDDIKAGILKGLALFAEDTQGLYQKALINLVREKFSREHDLKHEVANSLIKSKNSDASQLSAITLAEQGEKSELITEKVLDSLKNRSWNFRQLGLRAFAEIKTDSSQDNAIVIKMSLDTDSDVAKTAFEIIETLKLTNEDLSTLNILLSHNSWERRNTAVKLISRKLGTAEATSAIISRISDTDTDVLKTVDAALSSRAILPSHLNDLMSVSSRGKAEGKVIAVKLISRIQSNAVIPSLGEMAKDSNWQVRLQVVRELAKRNNAETNVIVSSMIVDRDSDVKNAALSYMRSATFTNSDLGHLAKHLNNSDWELRRFTLELISLVNSPESTALIIPMLLDRDSDVQATTDRLLMNRQIKAAELNQLVSKISSASTADSQKLLAKHIARATGVDNTDALIRFTTSSNWEVRHQAVQHLSRLNNSKATSALIERYNLDTDTDVSKAALESVNRSKLDENHVAQIGNILNHKMWEKRQMAARLLGRTNSQNALNLLLSRASIERDQDVLREIQASISMIKG